VEQLELILGLVALGSRQVLIVTPLVKAFHYPLKTALIAGLGLAQIGEFSFVLASEGKPFGPAGCICFLGTTAVAGAYPCAGSSAAFI